MARLEKRLAKKSSAIGRRQTRAERTRQRKRAQRRWQLVVVVAFALLAAGLSGVLILGLGEDKAQSPPVSVATSSTEAGPYDFAEAGDEASLNALATAKFVSVTIQNPEGVKAYSVSPERAEFTELAALLPGRPIDLNLPVRSEATVTFVAENRSTVTFELDLSQRVGTRGEEAWELSPAVSDVLRRLQTPGLEPTGRP